MSRTAQFNRQALAALAAKQHGVIARPQAFGCGMTERPARLSAREELAYGLMRYTQQGTDVTLGHALLP
jgi:hypothetical protein